MARRLARARIELQLKAQLDVVCQRIALVIIEGVVEYGEDSLRGDRVGGVGQHGAEHVREGRHLVLIGAPETEQREGVGPVCIRALWARLDRLDERVVLDDLTLHRLREEQGLKVLVSVIPKQLG